MRSTFAWFGHIFDGVSLASICRVFIGGNPVSSGRCPIIERFTRNFCAPQRSHSLDPANCSPGSAFDECAAPG